MNHYGFLRLLSNSDYLCLMVSVLVLVVIILDREAEQIPIYVPICAVFKFQR